MQRCVGSENKRRSLKVQKLRLFVKLHFHLFVLTNLRDQETKMRGFDFQARCEK